MSPSLKMLEREKSTNRNSSTGAVRVEFQPSHIAPGVHLAGPALGSHASTELVDDKRTVPGATWAELEAAQQSNSDAHRDFEKLNTRTFGPTKVSVPGRIKGFRALIERWGFSRKDAATMLGFDDETIVAELFAGIDKLRHRDSRDRLRIFLSTAVDLYGLYDDDAVIVEWLDQPKKILGGSSPRGLLLEGSMENMIRVQQLIRLEANR